ncbi:hypothetical protein M3M50_10650 [Pseudomonas bijieensis]|uniref:hypothetical protein n=1 Tax=Pseudomonas bijieensis TaxID=2681983 RepID=UPI00200F7738|nr:hypothetical protein [Pseudomonas bijieensis]UQI33057.1 hypothetical protein M3M50_10650 [Pseudomonas bijieensis]
MNAKLAKSAIELESAKISRSHCPVADRTFVMGMIDLAEIADLINRHEANAYRDALDLKFCERNDYLKRASA